LSSLIGCTEKDWSDRLVVPLEQDIIERLPGEIEKICEEVHANLTSNTNFIPSNKGSVRGSIAKGLISSGIFASFFLAPVTGGITLVIVPVCLALSYGYSKTWSRKDIIRRIVFKISEKCGKFFNTKFMEELNSHVDKLVQDVENLGKVL
jgi:hypothetical protein